MTAQDFQDHLKRARDTLLRSRNYMSLYVEIAPTDTNLQNRYIGFFSNVESSLRLMALVYLSTLFDNSPKTAGLKTLIRVAQNDRTTLARYAGNQGLRNTRKILNSHLPEQTRLRALRDQHLVHLDLDAPEVGFTKGEYDALIGDADSVIRDLYQFHDGGGYITDAMDRMASEHWAKILNLISGSGQTW